jgi:hypothetical protein
VNGATPDDPALLEPVSIEVPKPKTPKPAQLDLF